MLLFGIAIHQTLFSNIIKMNIYNLDLGLCYDSCDTALRGGISVYVSIKGLQCLCVKRHNVSKTCNENYFSL